MVTGLCKGPIAKKLIKHANWITAMINAYLSMCVLKITHVLSWTKQTLSQIQRQKCKQRKTILAWIKVSSQAYLKELSTKLYKRPWTQYIITKRLVACATSFVLYYWIRLRKYWGYKLYVKVSISSRFIFSWDPIFERLFLTGCQNKPATGAFHRLFWILCQLFPNIRRSVLIL